MLYNVPENPEIYADCPSHDDFSGAMPRSGGTASSVLVGHLWLPLNRYILE
jgi:hypothetical protein